VICSAIPSYRRQCRYVAEESLRCFGYGLCPSLNMTVGDAGKAMPSPFEGRVLRSDGRGLYNLLYTLKKARRAA